MNLLVSRKECKQCEYQHCVAIRILSPSHQYHARLCGQLSAFSVPYTHSLTHSLTPCSRVLPEKLAGPQPVKRFPSFYGARRFITVYTRARHLSLSWASSILSTPTSHFYNCILISSSHLCLGFPSGLLPSGFPTKALYAPLLSPFMLYVLPISVFFIWWPEWYLARSTEHNAPYYVVFSTPLLPRPSYAQISFSAPYSRKPSANVNFVHWIRRKRSTEFKQMRRK
jgi:hypothetical protein